MKVVIFGYGKTGRSIAKWLLQKKYIVTVIDQKKILSANFSYVAEKDPFDFSQQDLMILSPGIPLDHPKVKEAQLAGIKILGEMEFVLHQIPNRIIAITGTNGKTSVTSWIAQTLNFYGICAEAMGNIGVPISELLIHPEPEKVIVLEISSFQLQTLKYKSFSLGIILNISEDHLDHHQSFQEYVSAKMHLDQCMKPEAKLFVSEKIQKHYAQKFTHPIQSYETISFQKKYREVWKKQGLSLQNLQAVYAILKEFYLTKKDFFCASKKFKKPPHRMELILQKNQICFYNDSKATNVAAVVHAVHQLKGSIILIAGGKDKKGSYEPWKNAFKNKVKKVLLMGEAKERIFQVLFPDYDVEKVSTLNQAVDIAWKMAKPNDIILFSPGCSSFGQFENYKHRGQSFKKIVSKVAK